MLDSFPSTRMEPDRWFFQQPRGFSGWLSFALDRGVAYCFLWAFAQVLIHAGLHAVPANAKGKVEEEPQEQA